MCVKTSRRCNSLLAWFNFVLRRLRLCGGGDELGVYGSGVTNPLTSGDAGAFDRDAGGAFDCDAGRALACDSTASSL